MRNITKKALASALSFALCLGVASPLASALVDQRVNVETNIQVSENDANNYKEELVYSTGAATTNYTFDYRAVIDMKPVRDKFVELKNMGEALILGWGYNLNYEKIDVDGQFVITITLPDGFDIPVAMKEGTDLYGFKRADEMRNIYEETVDRTFVNNVLTITVDVKDKNYLAFENPTAATPYTVDDTLFDLELECKGVEAIGIPLVSGTNNDFTVKGAVTGYTTITVNDPSFRQIHDTQMRVDYDFIQDPDVVVDQKIDGSNLHATVRITKGGGYIPSGGGPVSNKITVNVFNKDNDIIKSFTGTNKVDVDLTDIDTEVDGFDFTGWYKDNKLTDPLEELKFTATQSMAIYPGYKVDAGDVFDTENHFAYIIGYPDGTVRPQNNISREEVVTIFFRLLTDDARNAIFARSCEYPDVIENYWSTNAISTLTNGGYIEGYEDGTFRPHNAITRAEFVTIAARFFDLEALEAATYSDVAGHWAAEYIAIAEDNQWIKGDGDGSFRPDDEITRAETMAIVNRMLNRHVDADSIIEVEDWIDNLPSEWYYYEVLEATKSHDYTRPTAITEKWFELTENRDWAALEK